jgi:hypothetical protein
MYLFRAAGSDDMVVPVAYRQKDVFYFAYVPMRACYYVTVM